MLDHIRLRIYYRFLELMTLHPINEKNNENSFKNCFIYFDYEREFSGHPTEISDCDIEHLLEHLDQINLKTTWFTVGKVMEKYPDTISKIVEKGHEIGSHTYAHVSPKVMKDTELVTDFESFDEIRSKNNLSVEGFHSPNGQWNVSMFDFLLKKKFSYDVIFLTRKAQNIAPMKFHFFKAYPILRLVTVGDDWPLYKAEKSRLEVFEYFKDLYLQTKNGDIFGIGFHPWILFSDKNILMGYKDFLLYLTQQNNIIIKPAKCFVSDIARF